jgi:hypothetical protein
VKRALAALILTCSLCGSAAAAGVLDTARPYLDILEDAILTTWPDSPAAAVMAGQVEQESSWKAKATLKTKRELGRGLVQMTIAYTQDGKERFNIYRSAVRYKQLSAWNWRKDPYNVRYQLMFLALQDKANYNMVRPYFRNDTEACKGMLVCYNAGEGRWLRRLKNARIMGLPTDIWDGGLAQAYSQGELALLYGRPLWVAVNEYPTVIFKRAVKYEKLVKTSRCFTCHERGAA